MPGELSRLAPVRSLFMTDPRNVAHDKKVAHDKEAAGEDVAPGADETPQPGRKPHMEHHAGDDETVTDAESSATGSA